MLFTGRCTSFKYIGKENWRVLRCSGKNEEDKIGFNMVMLTRVGRERVFTSRMRNYRQSTASISAFTSLSQCASVRKRALKMGFQICWLGFRPKFGWDLGRVTNRAIAHVRSFKIQTWIRGWRDKMANFSRLHCLAIPRGDLTTKRTKPNLEVTRKPRSHVIIEIYRTGDQMVNHSP